MNDLFEELLEETKKKKEEKKTSPKLWNSLTKESLKEIVEEMNHPKAKLFHTTIEESKVKKVAEEL